MGPGASNDCMEVEFFPGVKSPHYNELMYGDPIRSFRPLLKRYTKHTMASADAGTANTNAAGYNARFLVPQYPQTNGRVAIGTSVETATGDAYNVTINHLANLLDPCFLAKRGGFRWWADFTLCSKGGRVSASATVHRFNKEQMNEIYGNNYFLYQFGVGRSAPIDSFADRGGISAFALFDGTPSVAISRSQVSTLEGAQVFSTESDSLQASYELPFYHPRKFVTSLTPVQDTSGSINVNRLPYQLALIEVPYFTIDADNPTVYPLQRRVTYWCAAADDFTMNVFLGVPLWDTVTNLPAKAALDTAYWAP
jgi:hypothetical protein